MPKYFATTNKNKISEARGILKVDIEQLNLDLLEPQEIDVEKVVITKAKDAFERVKQPVIVEDSSLEILSWNGLPGALVKWFVDSVGVDGIVRMLSMFENKDAVAKTSVAFFDGNKSYVFTGELKGKITTPKGNFGFGWDSIFIPDGSSKTFAEMTPEEKNSVSMRKLAFEKMKSYFDHQDNLVEH